MPRPPARNPAGFSLIEFVVVIVVVGIIASVVHIFMGTPVAMYLAASRRAESADIADTALMRIARDVRSALPNSLRLSQSGGSYYLEFLPVLGGGRYRQAGAAGCTLADDNNAAKPECNILNIVAGQSDSGFQVLGPAPNLTTGLNLAIDNQGSATLGKNAWAGNNLTGVAANGAGSTNCDGTAANTDRCVVALSPALAFATPLPDSKKYRFYLIGAPVTYVCTPNLANPAAGELRRYWGYTRSGTQPTSFAGGTATGLLATRVKACSISCDQGHADCVGARQLTLSIQLENGTGNDAEQTTVYREVVVNNES